MIRKFAKIRPNLWKSEKMRAFTPNGKLLAMYLLTSPFYCMVGIYEQSKAVAQKHTGLSVEAFAAALAELQAINFVRFDEDTEVVWVVDMALTQIADGGLSEQQRKGVINELTRLKTECQFPFVDEFINYYREKYPFLPSDSHELDWDQIPYGGGIETRDKR